MDSSLSTIFDYNDDDNQDNHHFHHHHNHHSTNHQKSVLRRQNSNRLRRTATTTTTAKRSIIKMDKSISTSKSHHNLLPIDNDSILPPEQEQGNVEYKLKLINPSPNRLEHLVTQMKWRLEEG